MNDPDAIGVLQRATELAVGPGAVAPTDQSLGGEDFAWYLEHVPGAMARLGVRPAGVDTAADLHTPGFDPDEDAITLGMTVLASCALLD
jgi:amidohydrolase